MRGGGPVSDRPPVVELLHTREVRARNDNRLALAGVRDNEREWRGKAAPTENGFDLRERTGGKGRAVFARDDDVRAVVAEFAAQFRLHIGIKIEHGGRDGRGHNHGEQRGGGASAAQYRGANQHAEKHRRVRPRAAAGRELLCECGNRLHSSPRNAYTGSRLTAPRIAVALPKIVTSTAITRTTGSNTGCTEICESKIVRPIWRASTLPAAKPATPPISASSVASAKKTEATAIFPAPSAFINPTSPRRSKIAVAMAAETASAEANNAASVTRKNNPSTLVSTAPSFCATWRICSACECGIASCNWYAIDCG